MARTNLQANLGDRDELVQARPHLLQSLTERMGPQPEPWSPASSLFVMLAGLKDIASRMPEGQKGGLGNAIGQAADEWD